LLPLSSMFIKLTQLPFSQDRSLNKLLITRYLVYVFNV
jgi:hypothetical protein